MGLITVRDRQVGKSGCFPKPSSSGQAEAEEGQVALLGYFWNNWSVFEGT